MQGSLENSGLSLFLLDDFTIKKIEEHTESVMIANRLFYKSLDPVIAWISCLIYNNLLLNPDKRAEFLHIVQHSTFEYVTSLFSAAFLWGENWALQSNREMANHFAAFSPVISR